MTEKYDALVIGGGIVGLATAHQLLQAKPSLRVSILEKEQQVAQHQTGNNSGVIHSGVYYKPGSEKATNCQKGYRLLLDFCDRHDISYELCGKVIVAVDETEVPALDRIHERGTENGLKGLKVFDRAELKEKEPFVHGLQAIWVPQAGIVDYKDVSVKLAQIIKSEGGEIKLGHQVTDLAINPNEAIVETNRGAHTAQIIVNCAGLYSDKIAQMTGQGQGIKIIPFRGEYYELKPDKAHLVNGLIYPVPNPAFPFLGVHFTKMIKGGVEAGPNAVLAFRREGYRNTQFNFNELLESITYPGFLKLAAQYWREGSYEMYRSYSKRAFVRAMQTLIPSITKDDVVKGGAGVRAQACTRDGKLVDDFLILERPGVVNVCNAPSPAATSSLAIGETIAAKVLRQLEC